jgi:pentatricopeptide repeat domain-containing protein 1
MKHKVTPDIYHYNLLIRAIKECGIGDPLLANQLLHNHIPTRQSLAVETGLSLSKLTSGDSGIDTHSAQDTSIQIEPISNNANKSWWAYKPDTLQTIGESFNQNNSNLNSISVLDADIPDILTYKGDFSMVSGLLNVDSPQNRLALFGGLPKILINMKRDGVQPDIRTFTQFLDLIPSNVDSEMDLLVMMNINNVKPDVDFFNLLIRKRNLRHDRIHARVGVL